LHFEQNRQGFGRSAGGSERSLEGSAPHASPLEASTLILDCLLVAAARPSEREPPWHLEPGSPGCGEGFPLLRAGLAMLATAPLQVLSSQRHYEHVCPAQRPLAALPAPPPSAALTLALEAAFAASARPNVVHGKQHSLSFPVQFPPVRSGRAQTHRFWQTL